MGRNTNPGELNPYERRRQNTERRLFEALDRLIAGTPHDAAAKDRQSRFSVASLAREAGVARNAIYTNHRALIEALSEAARQQMASSKGGSGKDRLAEQRAAIDLLKAEQQRLVTENAALLKRALDAEAQAERYRRQHARLLEQWTKERSPIILATRVPRS